MMTELHNLAFPLDGGSPLELSERGMGVTVMKFIGLADDHPHRLHCVQAPPPSRGKAGGSE